MGKMMLGVIDATTYKQAMSDLTAHRSIAAVPFAGRYRLIDFVLSNMVNSGIESVAIFPKYQYRSLMDHLGSGKHWDLNRKRDGLFFFPSPDLPISHIGSFQHFQHHIDYFLRSRQKYALICNSYTVCNMNYEDVLRYHIDRGCDITRVCHRGESLNMFVLKTSLLLDLIADQQRYQSIVDVVNDMKSGLTICDYEYDGYVATIDSVERYFYHSLQLLDPNVWKQLFVKTSPIYTKVKDEPPTKYTAKATVKNAMIANGCIIDGTIEKSILFRAVKIGENTVVKNSVVMQKSQIGEGCYLENVIIDKDVRIGDGIQLIGTETHPVVIRKGTIQGALMKS